MSAPMALFGLVWLLRVRGSLCGCTACSKERTRVRRRSESSDSSGARSPERRFIDPDIERRSEIEGGNELNIFVERSAEYVDPKESCDIITLEHLTRDVTVQTDFDDDEDTVTGSLECKVQSLIYNNTGGSVDFEYPTFGPTENKSKGGKTTINVISHTSISEVPNQPRPESSQCYEGGVDAAVQYDSETEALWETEEVCLERGGSGLGLSIAGGAGAAGIGGDEVCVTKIADGGAAQRDGRLKLGDVILQVNDISVEGAPHAVAVDALQRAGNIVTLRVRRARRARVVVLCRGTRGLGLGVASEASAEGEEAGGVFVSHIAPGGAAAVDGRLRPGDRILAVRDDQGLEVTLTRATHAQAVSALRSAGARVTLVVQPAARLASSNRIYAQRTQATSCSTLHELLNEEEEPCDVPRCVRVVRLVRSGSRLGMDIVGGAIGAGGAGSGVGAAEAESGGVFVSGVSTVGAARGRLHRGDRILSVDGRDLSQATHEQAAAALKFSGAAVTIAAQYQPEQYGRLRARIRAINAQARNPQRAHTPTHAHPHATYPR